MFYAQFVLSKKGPLAKIWLAAHWEKKLSKAQIYETNVQDAVDEILQPKVKMALRTTGHLLLGIVRIYSRKTKYLLADCNEAFMKIKMNFRPGQVDLADDLRDTATTNAITLPEVFSDFDAALPDFNDMDFASNLHMNQSRIDDITLKDDLVADASNAYGMGNEFGTDDFGEAAMGMAAGTGMDDFGMSMDDFGELPMNQQSSMMEEMRAQSIGGNNSFLRDIRDATPNLEGARAPGSNIFGEEDFGTGGGDDDDMGLLDKQSVMGDMGMDMGPAMPGADMDDMALGAAANNMDAASIISGQDPESFALEPLEAGALDKERRPRRKRRLIIDEQKNISGEEMKANMADYRDTLQPLDLAPPTRRLMKLKESGNVERLFNLPGCAMMRARPVLRQYQQQLCVRVRDAGRGLTQDDVRREMEMAEHIDAGDTIMHNTMQWDGGVDEFDDVPIMDTGLGLVGAESPMGAGMMDDGEEMMPPMEPIPDESRAGAAIEEELASPKEKKERSRRHDRTQDTTADDEAAEGDDDHRWTKRTQNVLNSIATKIRASDKGQIEMSDLLTKASNRKTAAQKFYTVLVLKKWQAIEVAQKKPYDEIFLSAGPKIGETQVH